MNQANLIELFEYEDNFYAIESLVNEPRELYLNRVKYIFDSIKNGKSLEESKKLSIIWSNVKNYNCEYSESIMKKL
jgi:hypothetical protein